MNAMMRNNRNYLAVFTGATGCLCENTIIKGQTKTLGELYLKGERFIDTISFSHNPTKSQSEIIDSGKKELYEIELDEGKNVKATKEHKFLTVNGWKKLGELNEGDDLIGDIKIKSIKKIGVKAVYDIINVKKIIIILLIILLFIIPAWRISILKESTVKKKIPGQHQIIEEITADTYGVVLYQEQMMWIIYRGGWFGMEGS